MQNPKGRECSTNYHAKYKMKCKIKREVKRQNKFKCKTNIPESALCLQDCLAESNRSANQCGD